MRIKQTKLKNLHHDKAYVRFVNDVHVTVMIYSNPDYMVNVIADNGKTVIRHCYKITKEEYDIYMSYNNVKKQRELIAKGGKVICCSQ